MTDEEFIDWVWQGKSILGFDYLGYVGAHLKANKLMHDTGKVIPAGTKVMIWAASRFGHFGINRDLNAMYYEACVMPEELEKFFWVKEPKPFPPPSRTYRYMPKKDKYGKS